MLKISGQSKHLNLQGNFKLYYILAIGAFVSILSFVLYRDAVVTVVMVACTIALYIIFSRPPSNIEIVLNEMGINIGPLEVKWDDSVGWAMVDLGDIIEFVILTTNMSQQFYYFYINDKNPGIKPLVMELSQYLPYSEEIPNKNIIHNTLRKWGLR
jgi:hypothetical protein